MIDIVFEVFVWVLFGLCSLAIWYIIGLIVLLILNNNNCKLYCYATECPGGISTAIILWPIFSIIWIIYLRKE